jgi:predicted DNA-binding protein
VERTQISLTSEQANRLRRIASRRGTSMAALIREAVDRVMPNDDSPGEDERWAQALAAVGTFRGDGANVSVEHDRFLDQAFGGPRGER